ncbi:MAG: hypothetical protein COB15_10345 [Flavobacteriales bacterium]|nr:MAG: hypothetical protein COB15_10345 [Flavobacteriales bacterium]
MKSFKFISGLLLCLFSINMLSQIQPPAGIGNNIILWLSPDTAVFKSTGNVAAIGNRVREWHDISGGGFVFTTTNNGTRPKYVTYQGKNMLNFSGGDLLENTAISSLINGMSEFSIYIVIKSDDINTDQGFLDSENPDGHDEIICMRYDNSGANTGRTNVIKCGMQGNTSNNQVESQNNTQTNLLQCLTLTWKQGEKINLYIDGVLNESSVNNLNSVMSGVQKILLGKGPKDTGGGKGWDGRIGTVIFYNTKMSPDSVSLISGDLTSISSVQSGDWNDPDTWDCNCNPLNNDFVKINSNHQVTLTQNETVGNIIIEPQGLLDLSSNNLRLNVKNNFTNNGSLNSRSGKIKFIGTEEQMINGSSTSLFYNLHVNNNNGVRVENGNVNIQGSLYIQSGCFNTRNKVTLISNETETARIAELINGACIVGDITMQRFINVGATHWRFLTSAVSGATLADMNDDFITSGFTGSDYPNWPSAANPWPSIYYYDETVTGVQDNGFTAATNSSNLIPVGTGVWVWSGDTITGTQPFTIDITGPPNVGTINLPITYTNSGLPNDDGWNMVGNPYPSSIDWNSSNITKTGINNAIYIWNPDLQQFASYSGGIGVNGGSNTIASSQAMWVQATSSGASIQLTESCKTSTDAPFLKLNQNVPLRIKATNNYGQDELAIVFENDATDTFDADYDALKMASVDASLPVITSVMNGESFSINQLPNQEIDIPIKLLTGLSGMHSIQFENVSDFVLNSACLILEDLFTGASYDLKNVSSFTTYINDTTTVARFLLRVGAPVTINTLNPSCNLAADARITYSKNSNIPFDIIWRNNLGNVISSNTNIYSDSIMNIAAGTYTIETTDAVCGNTIETVEVIAPSQITSYFATANDTVYLNNGGNVTFNNLSTSATDYLWDFNDGSVSNQISPVHTYTQPGNYLVNLTASINSNCSDVYSHLITVEGTLSNIEEIKNNQKATAYFNNDLLTIDLADIEYDVVMIRNVLGQIVYQEKNPINRIELSVKELSSSFFLITLIGVEGNDVIKIPYVE